MSELREILEIEDLCIPVVLQRGKRKTLALSITQEGHLLIMAPLLMPEKEIERFVGQRQYWIYKQTKRILQENASRVVRSEEEVRELREQARQVLTERTDHYKEILKVNYQRIRIGDQKTRWGSCSSRGTISYNWHLVLMPERIIDYVVVHELCHLVEMNHSLAFWKKVAEILPDYEDRRKWLKEKGSKFL